jgi:hypothetical protein
MGYLSTLRANAGGAELLRGVELLRLLNTNGLRRVPEDAPLGFVTSTWRPYVVDGELAAAIAELEVLGPLAAGPSAARPATRSIARERARPGRRWRPPPNPASSLHHCARGSWP